METLVVHPGLVPGSFSSHCSSIASDMSRHIDWDSKDEAILDEPLTSPSYSCLIFRIDNIVGPYARARFVVTAADYITVTVRDFLFGLNVYLHHVPGTSESADAAPEYRLADARALASTQYEVDHAFSLSAAFHEIHYPFPEKSVTLPGLAVSEKDFHDQIPHTPVQKRAVMQWLQGRSVFAGIEPDTYDEAMLVVRMVQPEQQVVARNHVLSICRNASRGFLRISGPV